MSMRSTCILLCQCHPSILLTANERDSIKAIPFGLVQRIIGHATTMEARVGGCRLAIREKRRNIRDRMVWHA